MKKITSLIIIVIICLSTFPIIAPQVKAEEIVWNTNPTPLPVPLTEHASVVCNGKIYVLGGNTISWIWLDTVYLADILPNGTIDGWTTTTPLPQVRADFEAFVWNGFVYVLGGSTTGGVYLDTTLYAQIQPDGTLGGWMTATSLPTTVAGFASAVWNGRIYVIIGGWPGWKDEVYYAEINPDGSIGSWNPTSSLPAPRRSPAAIVRDGVIYVIGGQYGSGTYHDTVYCATINPDGSVGSWSITNSIPVGRENAEAVLSNDDIYVIGGNQRSGEGLIYDTIFRATINPDGTIQSWTQVQDSLPEPRMTHTSVVFEDIIYVLGGVDTDAIKDTIYYSERICMRAMRKITIDNSGNAENLIDYQVFINITYDSVMQPDFDDLRFTWYNETSGQEVIIDYWLDKYVDSEYALVWVEVPKIRGLGQEDLYMYYGDPDATSGSNGEETFVFFDGFSTDTTANYQLWSPLHPTGNPNEFGWDPNGWLFVNASIRERYGRNSNVHVYHKTAVMEPSTEQYWLESRCKAFGDGWLDYLGVSKLYKRDSTPQDMYFQLARVRQGIRDAYPMNFSSINCGWGSWECGNSSELPTSIKCQWFRIGLGTALDGTVIGSFHDDDYGELDTLIGQTTHQDTEWWIDLIISRIFTDDWATMHAYFDYVRVRKFTDPEPSISIGPKEPLPATVDIDPDSLNLKSKGQWITAYIQLRECLDAIDIDAATILLNGTISPVLDPKYDFVTNSSEYLVDHNEDGVIERMVKFDRATVQSFIYNQGITYGEVSLTITGNLTDGTAFEGTGIISVNYAGDANNDGIIDIFDIGVVSAHWYPGPPTGTLGYIPDADFNSDDAIDIFDIGILSVNWGETTPQ